MSGIDHERVIKEKSERRAHRVKRKQKRKAILSHEIKNQKILRLTRRHGDTAQDFSTTNDKNRSLSLQPQ